MGRRFSKLDDIGQPGEQHFVQIIVSHLWTAPQSREIEEFVPK